MCEALIEPHSVCSCETAIDVCHLSLQPFLVVQTTNLHRALAFPTWLLPYTPAVIRRVPACFEANLPRDLTLVEVPVSVLSALRRPNMAISSSSVPAFTLRILSTMFDCSAGMSGVWCPPPHCAYMYPNPGTSGSRPPSANSSHRIQTQACQVYAETKLGSCFNPHGA